MGGFVRMNGYFCDLPSRFRAIVAGSPDACAIRSCEGGELASFSELERLSGRIAGHLAARGIRKGDVVALLNDKSPLGYATMLACLRIGAIYTNLDPDSPAERARRILERCEPVAIYNAFPVDSQPPLHASLGSISQAPVIELRSESVAAELDANTRELPPVNLTGDSPAYIMFTSGSTGYPKGAVISHGNLLRFCDWARTQFGITPGDRLTNVNPIYFDNSVFDFYASLFNGACLVPFPAETVRDARKLVASVDRAGCTIWFSVPSLLVYLLTTRALSGESFASLRKIIFGGEGFPKPKLKLLHDLVGARIDLENVYGPTETTCICSCHTIRDSDFEDMTSLATLGYLAPNFDYEIIAQDGNADFGELLLTGPQVGLGYYNDPDRSAAAFIQNPANNRYRELGYRTGDFVERDAEGRLHFRGRVDFQIKHLGYRIELEEIEAALNRVDGVREAAALYKKMGDGLGMIIAFAAVEDGVVGPAIVETLRALLPVYMVPSRVETRASLPKNANGKIDRPALQAELGS